MILTVAKLNTGSARTYSTPARLAKAIVRAGAKAALVDLDRKHVRVEWSEGVLYYPIDEQGNVDQQLAWDME